MTPASGRVSSNDQQANATFEELKLKLSNARPGTFFLKIFDVIQQAWNISPEDKLLCRSRQQEILQLFVDNFKAKAVAYCDAWQAEYGMPLDAPIIRLKSLLPHIAEEHMPKVDADLQALCDDIPAYARPVPKQAFCIWEGPRISDAHLGNLARFLKLNDDHSLTLLSSNPAPIHAAIAQQQDGGWLARRLKVEKPSYPEHPVLESAIQRENNGPYANYAAGSDIGRVHALVTKGGGLYFDVDCVFTEKLPPLRAPLGFLITWKVNLIQGIFAVPPGCNELETAMSEIKKSYDDRRIADEQKKGQDPYFEEMWVSKRANLTPSASQKDERSILVRTNHFFKELDSTSVEQWKLDQYTRRREALAAAPRELITEETTVFPFIRAVDTAGALKNYRLLPRSVNVFGAMMKSGSIEMASTFSWNRPAAAPRRASF